MNIFFLSEDPYEAAQFLCDKHVVKMAVESAQLLSTAHRILDDISENSIFYKATHKNHPSAKWCRETSTNYNWLADHLEAILKEYTFRYGKIHKIERDELLHALKILPKNISINGFTIPPLAMDEQYIIDNPNEYVINYRSYYIHGKKHLHKWTNRNKPNWIG